MFKPLLSLLSLILLAVPALASDSEAPPDDLPKVDEPIPDLPVVEAEHDPVRELLGQAANPGIPEDVGQARFNELVALGAAALPTLAAIYRDPASTELESWVAARALGHIGGEGSRMALIAGLESPRIVSRLGAVSGLELMKDKESIGPLEKALFDKAMTVRASAADALAAIGNRKSSTALSEALDIPANFKDGKSLFVRHHIIVALGEIGSIGGIEALVGVLDDPEPELALAAVHSLSTITGMSFRSSGTGPDAPVSQAEIQAWKNWWSNRRVGETKE